MDLNKLLAYSVDSGASDLHLSVGSIPMVRINGTMQPLNMDPLRNEDMESILPQVMDQDQLKLFKERKEIDFSASLRKLKERWERGEVSSEERKDEPVESKDGKEPEEEVGTEGDSADKVPGYGR